MSLIARYGGIYGHIPMYMGRVFFVSPAATYVIDGRTFPASDNHDGLHPERALRTINQAITNAAANAGDVILCLEGTHTVTAAINVNKAGLTFWGVHSGPTTINLYQPRTIVTSTGTSAPTWNINAANTEIAFLDIRPTTLYSAFSFQTGDAALNGFYLHHCHVDLETPAVARTTVGVDFGYRASGTFGSGSFGPSGKGVATTEVISNVLIEDCVFESDGAQGEGIVLASCYATVRRCHFYSSAGTWATPFRVATSTDNSLIQDCVWTTTATMSLAIDGALADVAGGVRITDCRFNVSSGANAAQVDQMASIRGFGTSEAVVMQCFTGGSVNELMASPYGMIARMVG